MEPSDTLSQDSTVGGRFLEVGGLLVLLIKASEVSAVVGAAVTDHNLRRVLVRHHNRGCGQL